MSPISARLAAADLYLYNMGIISDEQKNLLNLFEMHPKENYRYVSARVVRVRELLECDVYKYTGISVDKMLEYPPDVVDEFIMLCKEKIESDLQTLKGLKNDLKN